MKSTKTVLDLPVPTGRTVLMQHLQTLVIRGNPWWIGGTIPRQKFAALAEKMAARYPLLRDERGRTYDRSKSVASVHLIAYRMDDTIWWWILSSEGKDGLADKACPDAHVAKHAMSADGHITFDGYVLLYAHKKDARVLTDAKTGKEKKVLKDSSSWTWKITAQTMNEIRATLEREVKALNYGDDTNPERHYGVRGLLAFQRRRPLFSGVRTQVLQLHREADDLWSRARKAWLAKYPQYEKRYGENAGRLRSLKEIASKHLPKMGRFKVFGTETVRDLVHD